MKSGDILPDTLKRSRKVKSLLKWGLIDFILALFLFFLVGFYIGKEHDDHLPCARSLGRFLLSYMLIEIAHLIRKFILVCVWRRAKDPSQTATIFDLVFVILIYIPELCVFVWGNTIIYSQDMSLCQK
jgi:hypothetical protein